MNHSLDPTAERALSINLDGSIYGTFAEIGAGQEVARWFFSVGGAAGTVAKTMSAYDMTVSDAIYGKAARYVSRERVEEMLDHEFALLRERLDAGRGERTRFFAFADTAAARSYAGGNECHAWLGVRFQHAFRADPSEVVIHCRLLDPSNARQQEALGRLGVNLLHAVFNRFREPKKLVESLLDDIGRERLEIDWIAVRGPAFPGVDNRLLALHLVRVGFTPAILFDAAGAPVLASEALRHSSVLIERGRFAPVTRLNLEMMAAARQAFTDADGRKGSEPSPGPAAREQHGRNEGRREGREIREIHGIHEIMEITMNNLRDRGQADDSDFLARVDLLSAVGKMVLVSDIGAFHDLGEYLAARHVGRIGLVLGVPLLRELFNDAHYRQLPGGILEAFGRLFTKSVRLYVQPTRDVIDGRVISADTLQVAAHHAHLLEHLRTNGLIQPLPCDPGTLRTYSSDEVRSRICSGDPSWRDLVAPEVAALIDRHGYFIKC
ncbi:MAG: TonB-dependent receptor [Planctomycetia bacterium]|nr:TonB-dependent receptor [Planctomycetia bacterium]